MSRAQLRNKYLRARRRLDDALAPYDCGLELARHISPRVAEAATELEKVIAEVRAAMDEAARGKA